MLKKDEVAPVIVVDARGLICPLPLLRAKVALNQVAAGECIQVMATDAGSVRDFHSFVALSKHRLVSFETIADTYIYVLQKDPELVTC